MYDYGNARIAARRGALLDAATLDGLAAAGSAAGVVAGLERHAAWAGLLHPVRPVAGEAGGVLELAVERFRAHELAAVPTWYDGDARRLAEALVMDLDRERVVAILRRRAAGQPAEAISTTIVRGALLDGSDLGELARQATPARLVALLVRRGLVPAEDARALAVAAAAGSLDDLEAALDAAWHRARLARTERAGADGERVRALLREEAAERDAVIGEMRAGAVGAASLVERSLRLARLRRLAKLGRRHPGGIGAVAGYVAAVELQALRLRTVLARVTAGWSESVAGSFLGEA